MTASESPRGRSHRSWPVAVTLIALTAMLVGAFLYVYESLRRMPAEIVESGRTVAAELERVAAAFRTGTVTTSFISYATRVNGSSYLQFASLRQIEAFERRDEAAVLWGMLDLPDLVVRATAPVEYTYYLDLDGVWDLRLVDGRLLVVAPPIEFNQPAVDASRIDYEVRTGSLVRDEEEALRRLKSGITRMSIERARENLPLVREIGRREAERFVADWMAARFLDGRDYRVELVFPDELPATPQAAPRD